MSVSNKFLDTLFSVGSCIGGVITPRSNFAYKYHRKISPITCKIPIFLIHLHIWNIERYNRRWAFVRNLENSRKQGTVTTSMICAWFKDAIPTGAIVGVAFLSTGSPTFFLETLLICSSCKRQTASLLCLWQPSCQQNLNHLSHLPTMCTKKRGHSVKEYPRRH